MQNEAVSAIGRQVLPGAVKVAVVIPSYKVKKYILAVIADVLPYCETVYVVDDGCPEQTGRFVLQNQVSARVVVLFNATNLGVGGAVMHGYRKAVEDGAEIIVKIDGDGQMDASLIPEFVAPILGGEADYTKGNRFFDLDNIKRMPPLRIFDNAVLSFMAKLSTGYWDIFDPTNGYTAIHADVAKRLPHGRISERYFFETDLLFRLNTLRASVIDVPMDARYGDETSNLRIGRILGEFLFKHARNFLKRIFYNYCLRDVSIASLELLAGSSLMAFGIVFGLAHWIASGEQGVSTPVGTIMITAISVISGLQLLLAFMGYDIASVPRRTIHRRSQRGR